MKILVTGGAGFIGSHLVDALIEKGHSVVVVDNFSTGKEENLNSKADVERLDITSPELAEIFTKRQPDAVFHLAAQIDLPKSVQNPVWDAEQNIIGTINVLENSRLAGVKKVIFSSSAGVYGDNGVVPTLENSPLLAPSPYGIGKLAAEKYLDYYHQTHHLPYIALRYANAYGPRQRGVGEGGVVAVFIDMLSQGKIPTIDGDGEQTRDYIYVADIVAANLAALQSSAVGIFNIGTGAETSVNQLAAAIQTANGSNVVFNHGPARAVDQRRSALDNTKAKNELSWQSSVSLTQGIKQTVEWFKKIA